MFWIDKNEAYSIFPLEIVFLHLFQFYNNLAYIVVVLSIHLLEYFLGETADTNLNLFL